MKTTRFKRKSRLPRDHAIHFHVMCLSENHDITYSGVAAFRLLPPRTLRFFLIFSCQLNRAMASNLIAMASNLRAMASNLLAMGSNLLVMASILIAMASNLRAMTSNPGEMASNLLAMASNLRVMASNLIAMGHGLQPKSDGLQHNSDDLQPDSNGLQPDSSGLQPKSDGLQPKHVLFIYLAERSVIVTLQGTPRKPPVCAVSARSSSSALPLMWLWKRTFAGCSEHSSTRRSERSAVNVPLENPRW